MPVIKMEFARAGLAASATSESFLNHMQLLRDARAWSGGAGGAELPRFSESTVRYLERSLLARGADLRDAVFQFAHLIGMAAAISPSGRALDTLYGFDGPVRARRLAGHLAQGLEGIRSHVEMEENAFNLVYGHDQSYRLLHARLPLLYALLEFLLTAPDAPEQAREVMTLIARIEEAPQDFETVRATSNAIAATLNAGLDRMMRSRVERDRLEALAAHLDETARETEAGERRWTIDDGAILAFWLRGAEPGGRSDDFRQFRTVHRAFVALLLALREGEDFQRLYRPQAADDEEGYLQLTDDQATFETVEEGLPSPLDALAEDPVGRVKFLTGAETRNLEIAARLWGAVRAFPLAVLRSEVMGGAQNEIINALRFKRALGPLIALEKLEDPDEAGYPAVAERYARLRAHLRQMLHASAYVTATRRQINLPEPTASETRKAYRGVRRAGFGEAFDDPEIGEAFEAAITPLSELAGLLGELEAAMPGELVERFAEDRAVFADAFGEMYGKET
ncbi:hypothetical protein LNKW23_22980 [Paralimibaculum aggregatum]|uniref:Phosphoenolpyruvate carboxylase n=1 Tax=Paralimibaculum aggregatum TaxID=3036245 RepID=A0ABQ6LIH2_9RHOB|nr:hypothetical protein [Limibaculum sp. NKW23]GMG83085.1 hypothetical protein LNKW23_22980 [Limibaculum sp. NKW23]